MKIIRVSTENEVTTHEFPKGGYGEQLTGLKELVGDDCEIVQHVRPKRLYSLLGYSTDPYKDNCVGMLVDEEGLFKDDSKINLVGSFLYETDKHKFPIVGNILFVAERAEYGDIVFDGLPDKVLTNLKSQLSELASRYRGEKC